MIRLDNISFSYGDKKIIKDFSLDIGNDDRVCLFGQSGCGKTTLLRLILGLERPQKGQITGVQDLQPSVVFQENRLFPFMTVLENIKILGADQKTALDNLDALGLKAYADTYPEKLSGGMQRRASIARALSVDFDFLILDEPFTGLDQENIKKSADRILKAADGKPIIIVTHSQFEAELFGAKIINM